MAASAFLDVCRFNPTLGGTTDWTYSSAVTGYQSPAAAGVVNGAQYSYRAESSDLSQWEIGTGTYNTSTGVLSRTTVLKSTNSNAKVTFSAAPQVAIVALAEDLVVTQPATKSDQATPTSNVLAVTPLHQQDHPSAVKANVYFDGKTGATATINSSFNVSSVVRNSTGNYTINFTTAFASGAYAFNVTAAAAGVGAGVIYISAKTNIAAASFTFQTLGQLSGASLDCDIIGAEFLGAQ